MAKNDEAHRSLAAQFKRHSIIRVYQALVWGRPKSTEGRIELSIGRDVKDRKKFSSRTNRPKDSLTTYKVVERYAKLAARMDLFPGTGRTHQLRVHLAAIGCPILGDSTYGGRKVKMVGDVPIERVMLHACTLGFIHPISQQLLEFNAPIPPDMAVVVKKLHELCAGCVS